MLLIFYVIKRYVRMAIEISGKLIKLLPLQTGSGKNGTWNKQDFIIPN